MPKLGVKILKYMFRSVVGVFRNMYRPQKYIRGRNVETLISECVATMTRNNSNVGRKENGYPFPIGDQHRKYVHVCTRAYVRRSQVYLCVNICPAVR